VANHGLVLGARDSVALGAGAQIEERLKARQNGGDDCETADDIWNVGSTFFWSAANVLVPTIAAVIVAGIPIR
jgi:hypothetical protein